MMTHFLSGAESDPVGAFIRAEGRQVVSPKLAEYVDLMEGLVHNILQNGSLEEALYITGANEAHPEPKAS